MSLADDIETLAKHLRDTLPVTDARQVSVIQGFAQVQDLQSRMHFTPGVLVSVIRTQEDSALTEQVTVQITLLTRPDPANDKTRYLENLRIKPQVSAALKSSPALAPADGTLEWRSVFRTKPDRDLGVSVSQFVYTTPCTIGPDPDEFEPWVLLVGKLTYKEGEQPGAVQDQQVEFP